MRGRASERLTVRARIEKAVTPATPRDLPPWNYRNSVTAVSPGLLSFRGPVHEDASPRRPPLQSRWLPVLLAVVVADANFWYYASTGENDADYAGIVLFAFFGVLWAARLVRRFRPRAIAAVSGAFAAVVLMALREAWTLDLGFIVPYGVFAVGALLGASG
jgi:hypothetical protein